MNKATVEFRPVVLALTLACVGLVLAACGGGGTTATVPLAPSNVVATPGPGYVTVTWKDNSDNETGFEVFRTATTGLAAQQAGTSVGNVDPDTTTFVDMNIELEQEYQYSVVARNSTGSSSPGATTAGATVPVGVDLMVGTNNRRWEDANGTIFAVYLMLPEEILTDESLIFNIQISGPPGWNNDDLYRLNCGSESCGTWKGFLWASRHGITALAGEYTLTVTVDGQSYTSTATLTDPDFKFERPTGITVTSATSDSVTATWSSPAGTGGTYVNLQESSTGRTLAAQVVGAVDTFTFEGLELADGIHTFEVVPVNADVYNYPLKVEPFGLSYDGVQFLVGDALAADCASAEEVVTIPDTALLQAVRDALGRPTGDLTCLDMALLERLGAPDSGIASLEGLQYAVNLADLYLHNNDISDVGPLANLTALGHVNLNLNQVSDVEPFRNLTSLTSLHLCCSDVHISDVTALEGLVGMQFLNITGHHLGDAVLWPLLENYSDLQGLWVGENDLTNIDELANYPNLRHLQLSGNTLPDLAVVAALPNLIELQLHWAQIDDITALHGMTQLESLDARGLLLTDIGFLEEFEQLHTLHIAFNEITSLAPLVANPGIGSGDYVDVRNNPLDLEDPEVLADIQALRDRGVDLEY